MRRRLQEEDNLSDFLSPAPRQVSPPPRVYKRSVVVAVVLTLLAWSFTPFALSSPDEVYDFPDFEFKARRGEWQVKHPVIMIPGVFSSGLELWEGEPCAQKYLRHRPWTSFSMLRMMWSDRDCWMRHLRLDPGGRDPPGIRVRASTGIGAADWFMPGYWVWARIVEALATLGYDHDSLHMASYDWRLDLEQMEERDRYFTRLKADIELMVRLRPNEKAVVLCHSMGIQVWLYFMQWVTRQDAQWIEGYIHAVVSIGGPMLGLVKGIGSVMGETKEMVDLNRLQLMLMESLVSMGDRVSLFRTWMSGFTTLPIGGRALWPQPLVTIVDDDTAFKPAYYADDILDLLAHVMPAENVDRARKLLNSEPAGTAEEVQRRSQEPSSWHNPLATALPDAPSLRIYCLYGVGIPTEQGYAYRRDAESDSIPLRIDRDKNGVYEDPQGDATVGLLSNGFMCARGWPDSRILNPSGVQCINREYQNVEQPLSRGPRSGDHVDILGNLELLDDILAIASGNAQTLESRYFSDLPARAKEVKLGILDF